MAKRKPKSIVITGEVVPVVDPGRAPEATKRAIRLPAPRVGDVPSIVSDAGTKAKKRFATFFTDDIENENTRGAYLQASFKFFTWCEANGLEFEQIESFHVAAYREVLKKT